MMNVLKLHDEVRIISDLKIKAFGLIAFCEEIKPVKILVESHDILELSLNIANKFPPAEPGLFEYDESAMFQLRNLTKELVVFYHEQLPKPEFPEYKNGIYRLLRICKIPSGLLVVK